MRFALQVTQNERHAVFVGQPSHLLVQEGTQLAPGRLISGSGRCHDRNGLPVPVSALSGTRRARVATR